MPSRGFGLGAKLTHVIRSHVDPNPEPLTVAEIDSFNQGSVSVGQGFPDWRARIRSSLSATTILSGERYAFSASRSGHLQVRHTSTVSGEEQYFEYDIQGELALFNQFLEDPGSTLISSIKNQVIERAVQKIKGANTTLRGAVVLGESAKTVRMINSRSKKLHDGMFSYLNALRKRTRAIPKGRIPKTVADTWLEYQYGWAPLVSDIDDGAKALSEINYYKPPRIRISVASEGFENKTDMDFTSERRLGPISYEISTSNKRRYGCKIYGVVTCRPLAEPGQYLQTIGLKLDDFLPTLWELIPYSFLVDYFSNVGSLIDSYALNTSQIGWLNIGERFGNEITVTPANVNFDPPTGDAKESMKISALGSPFYMSRERVSRDSMPIEGLIPSLRFRLPGTTTKWLNIAALATSHNLTSRLIRGLYNR